MPTPKELAVRAVQRTTDAFFRDIKSFPLDRWRDSPGGQANDLFVVLEHLIECEPWWLVNIGVPRDAWPALPERGSFESAQAMVEAYRGLRAHLLQVLRDLPDEWYEVRPPKCEYGGFESGAELCCYMAEHDFYHNGQIQMLEMALNEARG